MDVFSTHVFDLFSNDRELQEVFTKTSQYLSSWNDNFSCSEESGCEFEIYQGFKK